MEVNYWAVFACAVASMAIGAVWYGPLFGRMWMKINGVDPDDVVRREAMQKSAGPLYGIQFLLSLLQLYVLAQLIVWTGAGSKAVWVAFFMWLGFVMPTVAGLSMWTAQSARLKWATFFISSGYQLVSFIAFGLILGRWSA